MNLFCTLYLDEDVSVLLRDLSKARGFDVTTARDQEMLGKSDEEQLAYSASAERCLLTHNRVDFERLHTLYIETDKRHKGIIIATRRNPYDLTRRVAVLLDSLTADEIEGQLFYIYKQTVSDKVIPCRILIGSDETMKRKTK